MKRYKGLTSHEKEPWREGIGLEDEGIDLINFFTNADSIEAHSVLVYIALNGTEENFLDAMECIHYFKQ